MDNKYSIYRNIRFNRTFRTIGKMSWWRIALGIVLIVYVILLSGLVSQIFAAREEFHIAEKLMISPEWMEKYKPETKAFIEAGVLYQDGKIEEAFAAFEDIEDFDAAEVMLSRCRLKLASADAEAENFTDAYDKLCSVDYLSLTAEEGESYLALCEKLIVHYEALKGEDAENMAEALHKLTEVN